MANRLYKDFLLVSFPTYDAVKRKWLAQVTISWRDQGHFNDHRINPRRGFENDIEAIEKGFNLGRLWVDQKSVGSMTAVPVSK
jgi:hypothetical protein